MAGLDKENISEILTDSLRPFSSEIQNLEMYLFSFYDPCTVLYKSLSIYWIEN